MNVRMLEILGAIVLFIILFLGVGALWGRLFPKALPPMPEQHPDGEEDGCGHAHSHNTGADQES